MRRKSTTAACGGLAALLAVAAATAPAATSTSESGARTILFGPVVKSGGEKYADLRARSRAESGARPVDRSTLSPLLIYIY